jgi:hypothetical protein
MACCWAQRPHHTLVTAVAPAVASPCSRSYGLSTWSAARLVLDTRLTGSTVVARNSLVPDTSRSAALEFNTLLSLACSWVSGSWPCRPQLRRAKCWGRGQAAPLLGATALSRHGIWRLLKTHRRF